MLWKIELPMEQRERFVILAQSDRYTKKSCVNILGYLERPDTSG